MKWTQFPPATTLPVLLLLQLIRLAHAQTSLVTVGHTNDGGFASGVALFGHYAYLANGADGLRVYDVSDPSQPVNVCWVHDGGTANDLAVSGNSLYLANGNDGLRVYDISSPASPVNVAHINDGGSANALSLAQPILWLANGSDGLRYYDLFSPTNPVTFGHTNNGGSAYAVAASSTYGGTFLASTDAPLRQYNRIKRMVSFAWSTPLMYIDTDEKTQVMVGEAYLPEVSLFSSDGESGLFILGISTSPPMKLFPLSPTYGPLHHAFALSGNYLYTDNVDDGRLAVLDLSNAAAPVVGEGDYAGDTPRGIAISGGYAFVANGADGLRIYSLGTPVPPPLSVSVSPDGVTISWPAPTARFLLQQSPDLGPDSWTTLSLSPRLKRYDSGATNQVWLTLSQEANFFYRLTYP